MVRIIESVEGGYDVREVEFGEVYRWRPESVVLECDCGERLTLTFSVTTCGSCGSDHASLVREAMLLDKETVHPWRYAWDREDTGIPF